MSKITLDLNFILKKIDGECFTVGKDGNEEEVHAGKVLAGYMAQQNTESPLKFWDWATTLHKKEPLQLDKSDLKLIKKFVEGLNSWTLVKAQLLSSIDEAEETIE